MKIKTSTIDELCNIEYGTRVTSKRDGGKMYPVYGGGGETFFTDKTNRSNRVIVSRFAMSKNCTRYVKGDFFLNDSGLSLSPKTNELSQKYLDKIILTINNSIYDLGRGTAQRNLDMKQFRLLKISYPASLSEQEQVTTKLNEVFIEIDKNIEITISSLSNTEEFYHKIIEKLFSTKNKNWKSIDMSKACKFSQGVQIPVENQSTRIEKFYSTRFLRIVDFTQGYQPPRYISDKKVKEFFKEDDIAIVRYGASAGFICTGLKGQIANNLFKISMINSEFENDYLLCFLKSPLFSNFIKKKVGGAAMPALSFGMFKQFFIEYPVSHKERYTIVSKCNLINKQVDSVKKLLNKKLLNLNLLKSVVLSKILLREVA